MMAPYSRWALTYLLTVFGKVRTEDARIASITDIPRWQLSSLLHLQLTAPESEALQLTYGVYPLTDQAGLYQSNRSSIWVRGSLVAAEIPGNTDRLKASDTIAFLCCDDDNATQVVNQLMHDNPMAILLYSIKNTSCSLEGNNLTYNTIYTMGNSQEASDTMNNTVNAGGVLRATITDNSTASNPPPAAQEQSGSNSAVAMSILYSITGLITLLFLVIIATGAIRAHRYPERYGPRSAYGGRPPQSRARGLARAVLETLPVVKFGDPSPGKPDPALELESQTSATAADPALGTRLSAIPEEPRSPEVCQSDAAPMSGAVPESEAQAETVAAGGQTDPPAEGIGESQPEGRTSDEHPGCSICTEDFTIGEDVRVLPCNHRFHPACIDPWLINISGTCPLCRLDLHPVTDRLAASAALARYPAVLGMPPYGVLSHYRRASQSQHQDHHPPTDQQRRRSATSRFLDLHRLRHAASIEERIEILRRHRGVLMQREGQRGSQGDGEGVRPRAGSVDAGRGEIGEGGLEDSREIVMMWGALQEREWRRRHLPPGWRLADWWRERRRLSALEREVQRPPLSLPLRAASAPVTRSVSVSVPAPAPTSAPVPVSASPGAAGEGPGLGATAVQASQVGHTGEV